MQDINYFCLFTWTAFRFIFVATMEVRSSEFLSMFWGERASQMHLMGMFSVLFGQFVESIGYSIPITYIAWTVRDRPQ